MAHQSLASLRLQDSPVSAWAAVEAEQDLRLAAAAAAVD